MEPEDEAVHPRRAVRHPHRRSPPDPRPPEAGLRVHPGSGGRGRGGDVRRHQEAGPGLHPVLRRAVQHAVCERALAGRDADQLPHHRQADLQDEGVPAHAGLGRDGRHAQEGGAALRAGADQAGAQPGRDPRHGEAARRGVHPRHQEGVHRGDRGPQAGRAHRGRGRHQLRPRSGGLRHPGQRRRHPLRPAHEPGRLRRRPRGPVHIFEAPRGQRGSGPRRPRGGRGGRRAGPGPSRSRRGGGRARGPSGGRGGCRVRGRD